MVEQLEIFGAVLAKQREHAVIGHDWRGLRQQVIFQGTPIQAQRLEEKPVGVVLGKAHVTDSRRNIQPQVLDKAGGADKTVQQRR